MTIQLMNLPSEILVKIFGLLDFQSYISMKSTCKIAKNVGEKNVKVMPKKEVFSIGIYYGYRRPGNLLTIIETYCNDKNKTFTFGCDDKLKRYFSNLKISKRLFIDEFSPSFASHFTLGPFIESVKCVELSNIKKSISTLDILPLFQTLKKCNKFQLEGGNLVDGKLSILLEQMDYCHSLRFSCESQIEIDDQCLQIISTKSTEANPFLQIYAPDLPSTISLPALITFLRSTNFNQNTSISLSRVFGSRHELITSFSPFIELHDSDSTIYDFQAVINVYKNISVWLNFCNLEEAPPKE